MEGPSGAKQKRMRSENWIEEDKNLLLELIKERVHIIENKNTDTNTNNKKKNAWVAVHESFNSICKGGQRSIAQLKVQWGHTKINKKKQLCAQRKEIFKTGGGGPPKMPPDDSEDITAWLPNEFTVDSNLYDSDQIITVGSNMAEPTSPLTFTPQMEEVIIEVEEDVELRQNEENEIPKQQQDSNTLKQKKKSEKTDKDIAKEKIQEIAEAELLLNKAKIANQERKSRNLDLKSRNLDLKYQVLQAKLEYYKIKKDKDC